MVVNLNMSEMNYNPEIKDTPVRDFLHGVNCVNPLLVQTSEVGRHTSDSELEEGRIPLVLAIPSVGSLYKDMEEEWFCLCLLALTLLAHPLLHCH